MFLRAATSGSGGSRIRTLAVSAVGTWAAIGAASMSGTLQQPELLASDAIVRSLSKLPANEVVIVGVDDALISSLGHWPLTDEDLAILIEKISGARPRAIGIDLYRDLPVAPGSGRLDALFESRSDLYGVWRYSDAAGVEVPPHGSLAKANREGFVNLPIDDDGRVRRLLLYVGLEDRTRESLPMRLAQAALAPRGIHPQPVETDAGALRLGATEIHRLSPNEGSYVGIDSSGFQILIDYRIGLIPVVSAGDVLAGTSAALSQLRDRIVLVGSTAESVPDVLATPLDESLGDGERMYGSRILGTGVQQLLLLAEGTLSVTTSLADWQEQALLAFLAIAATAVVASSPSILWSLLPAIAGLLLITGASLAARGSGLWLPLVAPALSWIAAIGSSCVLLYYAERRERRDLMQLFGRYVSPEVARELWRQRGSVMAGGRPVAQDLVATVLFTDIQGFTSISERLSGAALLAWLDRLLARMTKVVQSRGGIVDKFIGDAVMAVFGVPIPHHSVAEQRADACAAVQCALDMATELRELNAELTADGLPTVRMRVGVFTGHVLAGSLGPRERQQYTVTGDTVNTAARLESYGGSEARPPSDEHPVRLLIGASTYEFVRDETACSFVGALKLKGKDRRVEVYQVET